MRVSGEGTRLPTHREHREGAMARRASGRACGSGRGFQFKRHHLSQSAPSTALAVVDSLDHDWLFAITRTAALQAALSLIISRSLPKFAHACHCIPSTLSSLRGKARRASQVTPWSRICLPMQQPRVRSLDMEDPLPPREGNGYPLQYSCLENSMD